MYLYIFEGGGTECSKFDPDEETLYDVDDGVLDIIDISDPERPMEYYQGEWFPVDSID